MAENLPNDDEMVTEINLISQDYVEDDSVIAEVVTDVTKKVSRVVTRGFTKWLFSSEISHGVSFDVTVNNDSIEDSSTDDDEFVKVSTKKRRSRVWGFLLRIRMHLIEKSTPSFKRTKKVILPSKIFISRSNKRIRSLRVWRLS